MALCLSDLVEVGLGLFSSSRAHVPTGRLPIHQRAAMLNQKKRRALP